MLDKLALIFETRQGRIFRKGTLTVPSTYQEVFLKIGTKVWQIITYIHHGTMFPQFVCGVRGYWYNYVRLH